MATSADRVRCCRSTVARGELREDTYFYTGKMNGKDGDVMPFPVTEEVLKRGQERFNIYCAPCHSRIGDGNGMIVQRGYQRPPSYTGPQVAECADRTFLRRHQPWLRR